MMPVPAFVPSLPIHRPHQSRHGTPPRKRRGTPCLTIDPTTKRKASLPPPSKISKILSTPLTTYLHDLFTDPANQPPPPLPANATWQTPLFDCAQSEISRTFRGFFDFAESPTLTIHSIQRSTNSFSWTLSFIYPLPWRPRVSISGITTTDSLENPQTIVDEWYAHPITLIKQALPRLVDIIWLYPGPHAEDDSGLRKVLRRMPGYRIERFAPGRELRVRDSVETYERELMFATPTLPEQAFEGGLRKREKYSAVAPIGVRELDEGLVEWSVRVPGEFSGTGKTLPTPHGEGVVVEDVGERIMAVVRFGGFAMRDVVERKIDGLLDALGKEGVNVGRDRVWVRVYDCKVGFNEKGLLAMAMYGASTGVPRTNEIAVDVTGLVDEEFGS